MQLRYPLARAGCCTSRLSCISCWPAAGTTVMFLMYSEMFKGKLAAQLTGCAELLKPESNCSLPVRMAGIAGEAGCIICRHLCQLIGFAKSRACPADILLVWQWVYVIACSHAQGNSHPKECRG